MLVLVGSDREQGERGSGLGAFDRRTRSMVYSVTDKGRRRKRRCAKSQRTSLFLSFLDPSKPKPTKTTKNKIPSQRPNEATRKTVSDKSDLDHVTAYPVSCCFFFVSFSIFETMKKTKIEVNDSMMRAITQLSIDRTK